MQGRLHVDSLKSTGNGPIHSPVSGLIKTKHKKGKQTDKTHRTTTNQNQKTQRSGIAASSEKRDAR